MKTLATTFEPVAIVLGASISLGARGLVVALLAVACASAAGVWHLRTRGEAPARARAGAVPVVVEIFSSEGCSSCPPADEYVAMLDRDQPIEGVSIVALEMHVDYWDRLGWTDPYGSPSMSERQRQYASALDNKSVFTPEIIFDGTKIMEGGDEVRARAVILALAGEPQATVTLTGTGRGEVDVAIDAVPDIPSDTAEVWLAVTESHLDSDVTAGENRGRVLQHAPIVRELRKLDPITGPSYRGHASIALPTAWKPAALRFVVFAQAVRSRRILGAASVDAID